MKKNPHQINTGRRSFLKIFSLAGIGTYLASKAALSKTFSSNALSRVVIVSNSNASQGSQVNSRVVNSMINTGINSYTGLNESSKSWKSIFPDIKITDKIAIKVNCTEYSSLGVPFSLTKAVIDGLTQMDFDGTKFPENNIIIYEFPYKEAGFAKHGYTVNSSNNGVQCYTISKYSTNTYTIGGVQQKLATLVTDEAQYIINIAILQDHYDAGISLCMKNHFGTINNPFGCHGDKIDECIAELNALEPIKNKQKFCIIFGILGATNSGTSYGVINCRPNKIIMGQDIVAVDFQGKKLLKELGTKQANLDRSKCIDIAATKYSLGTNNPDNMEVLEITDTEIAAIESTSYQNTNFRNFPNPFSDFTTFYLNLTESSNVRLRIIDLQGIIITTLINKKLESGEHNIRWNINEKELPNGIYLGELQIDDKIQTIGIRKF